MTEDEDKKLQDESPPKKKKMPSERSLANLKPFVKGEERTREAGRKGKMKQTQAIRNRKTLAALATDMLKSPLPMKAKQTLGIQYKDIDENDLTTQAAIIAGQIQSAIKGNTAAFSALIELQSGEEQKAAESARRQSGPYHIDLDIVADVFHPMIRAVRTRAFREFVLPGGRGSGKSSVASCGILEILKNNPDAHALVVRKVSNTLKDSVYAQLLWAINKTDQDEEWEKLKSPMEIRLKKTGQTIYFRGADSPDKIKSIKPPFGYIACVWFEELDQFAGPEEIRNIEQSAIRGGDLSWVFKTFNPPKSQNNWANEYVRTPKDGRMVVTSTYKDVPADWLGETFLLEAEHLKKVNPTAYENEYEGKANGAGGNVFTDMEIRKITDEEVATFDCIFQGVDWGLAPDPYVFVRLHYDAMRETIYFISEITGRGLRNSQTAQMIVDAGFDDFPMTCDSAEKKSVLDYRDLCLNAKPAIKGPGSVEYGMKWLCGRHLVIDPERTPMVFAEFTKYEFERDKEGNLISGYPDKDNHTIDATRYALERYCNKRYTTA